jgi:calcineurin-like phosphoesterase family protein
METFLPGVVSSYSEMQWRETVYLIIHLPFQQSKNEREQPKRNQQDSEGDYQG